MKTQFKSLILAALLALGIAQPVSAAYVPQTFKLDAATANRDIKERFKDTRNVKEWGAKCDGQELVDVTTTNGSAVVSSASHPFVTADVGKKVYLYNSHDEGLSTGQKIISAQTTIASVASGNATLATTATASNTATARMVMYTTDDTTAINAAITALTPAGKGDVGATLKFPAGICMATQINVKRQVLLEGAGRNNSRLIQIGGTNSTFIISENFATLTGTGANYGANANVPSWFGLKDIQIDGNRVYQSSGDCVTFYGNAQIWQRTEVVNCKGRGMFTEASGTYAYNPTDWRAQEEGFFDDLFVRNVGSHGWQMRGPHDSTVTLFVAYDWGYSGTGYGFINESSLPDYNGSAHFGQIHPYAAAGAKTSIYVGGGGDFKFLYSDFGSTVLDSAAVVDHVLLLGCGTGGVTPCLDITSNADYTSIGSIDASWNFGTLGTGLTAINVASGADAVSIDSLKGATYPSTTASNTFFKTRGNFGHFAGTVSNTYGTSNICADLGGTYNTVDFTSFGCATHVDYTAGGNNNIRLASYVNGGETAWTGGLDANDIVTKVDSDGNNYTNLMLGSATNPALTFGGRFTNGFWGAFNEVHASIAGVDVGKWTAGGGYTPKGTAPTVTTGAGDCGTSPTIVGNNQVGTVTVGSSTNGGHCTLTFSGGWTYANAPICIVQNATSTARLVTGATTTSTLVITSATTLTAADKLTYQCVGWY